MQPGYRGCMDYKAITFRLPLDLYERLRREAFETRRPMNELVAEAVAGRYSLLDRKGTVAHIDGDPRNNDPGNLYVWADPTGGEG